jgi:hypothetical protein
LTNVYPSRPPPVKMGACQALSQLLPEANKENIQPQLMGLFSSLTDLLHQVMLQEDFFNTIAECTFISSV